MKIDIYKKTVIYKDVVSNSEGVSMPTLDSYLNALERLFVIEDVDAWCPAIRSATTIRSGKKREFVDPSIAVAVLHIGDGRYALIEFKLGSFEIEEGAQHLLTIRQLVREYNKKEKQVPLREPDLMIVITGGNIAYTRDDGVKVIPISCLKN